MRSQYFLLFMSQEIVIRDGEYSNWQLVLIISVNFFFSLGVCLLCIGQASDSYQSLSD